MRLGLPNMHSAFFRKSGRHQSALRRPCPDIATAMAQPCISFPVFSRPFAYMIAEILRFALNDFSSPARLTGCSELDLARALLTEPESGGVPISPAAGETRREVCPIDHGTGQIFDLAVRMTQQERWSPILDEECRSIADSHVLDEMDKQKGLAIWAIAAWRLNARNSAIEPLRKISATYPFKTWAEATWRLQHSERAAGNFE